MRPVILTLIMVVAVMADPSQAKDSAATIDVPCTEFEQLYGGDWCSMSATLKVSVGCRKSMTRDLARKTCRDKAVARYGEGACQFIRRPQHKAVDIPTGAMACKTALKACEPDRISPVAVKREEKTT